MLELRDKLLLRHSDKHKNGSNMSVARLQLITLALQSFANVLLLLFYLYAFLYNRGICEICY